MSDVANSIISERSWTDLHAESSRQQVDLAQSSNNQYITYSRVAMVFVRCRWPCLTPFLQDIISGPKDATRCNAFASFIFERKTIMG